MNINSVFVASFRALKRNKMRSALTSVGIIIGVASVITMVGVGKSASEAVKSKINSYGSNAISVISKKRLITDRDVKNIKNSYSQIQYITPVNYNSKNVVKYKNKNTTSYLFGASNDLFKIKGWGLSKGRYFSAPEIKRANKVVILGYGLKVDVFGSLNPIGKTVIINDIPYKVIGIMNELGQGITGRDFDRTVVIPYTTAASKVFGRRDFDEIYVSTYTPEMVESVKGKLIRYFRVKHGLLNGQSDDFQVKTSKEQLNLAEYISNTLSILVAAVASISLIVGGIGIMNIMLVSVQERTREIGIRMAIGAKKRDILFQFLVEAASLSTLGGIIGIILGIIGNVVIVHVLGWQFFFSHGAVIISFLFSAFVGVFFGYYPAKQAAKLKPIEALRYE